MFDESVTVAVLLHTPFLHSIETSKGRNVEFKSRVHFFEFIGNNVKFDHKFVYKPYNEDDKENKKP